VRRQLSRLVVIIGDKILEIGVIIATRCLPAP
jgi:hypothetical protein